MDKINKKILAGTSAEIISATLTYPLNTLKTNAQVGIILKGGVSLFRGYKYCFVNELINGILFHTTYNTFSYLHPIVRAGLGAGICTFGSYPFYVRRKLAQVGKKMNQPYKMSSNYKGIKLSLLNTIPTSALNYTLKGYIHNNTSLGVFSGLLSTTVAIILSHPLDTLTTNIVTGNKIKFIECLMYKGFSQRFFERNLTISIKMFLIDYLVTMSLPSRYQG